MLEKGTPTFQRKGQSKLILAIIILAVPRK